MLSLTAVSSADYYLKACSRAEVHKTAGPAEYELDSIAAGEPPGVWFFTGRNHLGVEGEIHPQGPSGGQFRAVVNDLRHPVTSEALGSRPYNFATTEERMAKFDARHPDATPEQRAAARVHAEQGKREARHAYDATFSAPKSWSVWHAALTRAGRLEDADKVWAAYRLGIEAALRQAAEEHGWTRQGVSGPKVAGRATTTYVRAEEWQTAIFRHHTSRDLDPQLHAHVMVLNRVLCDDGTWRAMHAADLFKSKHQLDATALRVAEAELTRTMGVRFAARPDGKAREIVGVSEEVRELFSARSRALSEKAEELVNDWGQKYRREVPALLRWRMNQRATLGTRKAKDATPPSREDNLRRWEEQAATEFREGLRGVEWAVDEQRVEPGEDLLVDPLDTQQVVEQALADVERKATWNRSHLYFAISQRMPDMLAIEPSRIPEVLSELTDAALAGREVVSVEAPNAAGRAPQTLIDAKTGRSVFEAPEGRRYVTTRQLEREDSLVRRLEQRGAPALGEVEARDALDGSGLSLEQAELAVGVLTSDQRVELVNAAAGVGKSRVMAALSEVAADRWGHGLTGLTTAQNAADVLAREGVDRAFNIAAYLDFVDRASRGEVSDMEAALFAVPRGAPVVVDEASMVDTKTMTRLMAALDQAGAGKRILIGDTAQVDAVDAGGGFALLCEQRTPRTLTEVRRFSRQWERDASAAIRGGDVEAVAQYDHRARLWGHTDPEQVRDAAVSAYVADHQAGRSSVIVVGSANEADDLASRVRRLLVAKGAVEAEGVELESQLTTAGIGDLVQTRMNNRALGVVNRQVWQVVGTNSGGGLELVEARAGDPVTVSLPASYVKRHVELAYASTVEAVQGRSTDTGHLVVDRMMSQSRAYPGLTRGRDGNWAWVVLEGEETALGRVADVVADDDHTKAARSVIAEEQDRSTHLGHLGPQWQQLITEDRSVAHTDAIRRVLDPVDAKLVLEDPALGGVLRLLRAGETTGHDPEQVLEVARQQGGLMGAKSPASVLFARLDDMLTREQRRPERVAFTYADRTPQGRHERMVYARQVAEAMDRRTAVLGERVAGEAPVWAVERFGPVPDGPLERAGWSGRAGVVESYREQFGWHATRNPIGPQPTRAEPERLWVWNRAADVLGLDPREREMSGLSVGELANREAEWARCERWLPANVDEQLREAHTAVVEADRQVTSARTAGRDTVDLEATYVEMAEWVDKLEEIAQVRAEAYERTAEVRERAQEARAERERREEVERARLGLLHRDDPGAEEPEWDPEFDEPETGEHGQDEPLPVVEAEEPGDPWMVVVSRWFANHDPQRTVVFGSAEWVALDGDDPAKRAAVTAAAMRARQLVESGEAASLPERMAVRDAEDPTVPVDVEAAEGTHWWSTDHLMVDGPDFATEEWVALPDGDPGKDAAEAVEALRWWAGGDTLDARCERVEAAEEAARQADVERWRAEGHPVDEVVTDAELAVDAEPEWQPPVEDVVDEPVDRSRYAWVREANAAVPELGYEADKPTPGNAVGPEPEPRVTVVERDPEPVEDEPTPEPAPEEEARVEREQRRADLDRELERARHAAAVLADMRAAEQRQQETRDDEDRRSREALAEREAEVQQVELDA